MGWPSRNLIISIEGSIALALSLLYIAHGSIPGFNSDGAPTFFRYRCNITLIIQGDVSDIKDLNRVIVFPNTTTQTVFFEEVKCIVDGKEVQKSLTMDDGNAVLMFDIPQSSLRNGSIIMLCFTVKIIKRTVSCDLSSDELKRATLDKIPLDLVERFSGNSSVWPISIEVYNLSHELAGNSSNIFDILSTYSRWIEENIAYPLYQEAKVFIGPQYPDETYQRRVGDCDDCSILFITMCRAVGIPSFMQMGGIPYPSEERIEKYDGNYIYKSNGIAWHAWSMVYFPEIGWVPVDLTYFGDAKIETVPGGLAYIKSPLGLTPRIVSSAYFKSSPIVYANITDLSYVDDARTWEKAIAEGKIKYIHTEELEVLASRVPIPIEVPLILGTAFFLALLIVCLQLKRRKSLKEKV